MCGALAKFVKLIVHQHTIAQTLTRMPVPPGISVEETGHEDVTTNEVDDRADEQGAMGIKLLDHVIVGNGCFISMKNEGYFAD